MTLTPDRIINELAYCTGSENFYEHWTRRIIFTDGIKHMADICGAYWLIDAIASHQTNNQVAAAYFQVWTLTKAPTDTYPDRFILTCEDGNGNTLARQIIKFSDFPLDDIRIYVTDKTMLLPSEY